MTNDYSVYGQAQPFPGVIDRSLVPLGYSFKDGEDVLRATDAIGIPLKTTEGDYWSDDPSIPERNSYKPIDIPKHTNVKVGLEEGCQPNTLPDTMVVIEHDVGYTTNGRTDEREYIAIEGYTGAFTKDYVKQYGLANYVRGTDWTRRMESLVEVLKTRLPEFSLFSKYERGTNIQDPSVSVNVGLTVMARNLEMEDMAGNGIHIRVLSKIEAAELRDTYGFSNWRTREKIFL